MLLLAGICSVSVRAAGQREKVLHWFGAGKDGSTPIGGLVQDASGNLYGTAANAGAGGYGTVFELSPPEIRGRSWKETVLYAFQSVNDGRHPFGTLILDQAGNLYGTTSAGGRQPQCFDCGTVFELVRPARPEGVWREKILHSFNGKDGANPAAGLVADDQGNLYGTTFGGGATRSGTVFELMPPDVDHVAWTEKVLYSFTGGIDGNCPVSKLSFGPDGALYGTANLGGANGMGAVYRLAPPAATAGSWSETVICSFLGGSDGNLPSGGVLFDRRGRLYGTATSGGNQICVDSGGCGTVFRLIPPLSGSGTWSEQTLYEFSGADDGAVPLGDLIFGRNGSLYGTTSIGGPVSLTCLGDCGAVFQLSLPASAGGQWTETTLYFFVTAGDGHNPQAGLIRDAEGDLYGVTAVAGNFLEGGVGGGTVFEILP